MTDKYEAREYYRQAQRFIYPLYKKNGLGGFSFSSTVTFVTYKKRFFCIFAAHALDDNECTMEEIGMLATDGVFVPLSESCKSHKIYKNYDIVICTSETPFEPRYYFDLEPYDSKTNFNKRVFGWIGFPQKKAQKTIHQSKASPEKIARHLSVSDDGRPIWGHAKFLIIWVKIDTKSDQQITGRFENKNVDYEYEGFKSQGHSPRGMSGGALFHPSEKLCAEPRHKDMFLFAGIGLEYDGSLIKGAPTELIVSLIEEHIGTDIPESQTANVTP